MHACSTSLKMQRDCEESLFYFDEVLQACITSPEKARTIMKTSSFVREFVSCLSRTEQIASKDFLLLTILTHTTAIGQILPYKPILEFIGKSLSNDSPLIQHRALLLLNELSKNDGTLKVLWGSSLIVENVFSLASSNDSPHQALAVQVATMLLTCPDLEQTSGDFLTTRMEELIGEFVARVISDISSETMRSDARAATFDAVVTAALNIGSDAIRERTLQLLREHRLDEYIAALVSAEHTQEVGLLLVSVLGVRSSAVGVALCRVLLKTVSATPLLLGPASAPPKVPQHVLTQASLALRSCTHETISILSSSEEFCGKFLQTIFTLPTLPPFLCDFANIFFSFVARDGCDVKGDEVPQLFAQILGASRLEEMHYHILCALVTLCEKPTFAQAFLSSVGVNQIISSLLVTLDRSSSDTGLVMTLIARLITAAQNPVAFLNDIGAEKSLVSGLRSHEPALIWESVQTIFAAARTESGPRWVSNSYEMQLALAEHVFPSESSNIHWQIASGVSAILRAVSEDDSASTKLSTCNELLSSFFKIVKSASLVMAPETRSTEPSVGTPIVCPATPGVRPLIGKRHIPLLVSHVTNIVHSLSNMTNCSNNLRDHFLNSMSFGRSGQSFTSLQSTDPFSSFLSSVAFLALRDRMGSVDTTLDEELAHFLEILSCSGSEARRDEYEYTQAFPSTCPLCRIPNVIKAAEQIVLLRSTRADQSIIRMVSALLGEPSSLANIAETLPILTAAVRVLSNSPLLGPDEKRDCSFNEKSSVICAVRVLSVSSTVKPALRILGVVDGIFETLTELVKSLGSVRARQLFTEPERRLFCQYVAEFFSNIVVLSSNRAILTEFPQVIDAVLAVSGHASFADSRFSFLKGVQPEADTSDADTCVLAAMNALWTLSNEKWVQKLFIAEPERVRIVARVLESTISSEGQSFSELGGNPLALSTVSIIWNVVFDNLLEPSFFSSIGLLPLLLALLPSASEQVLRPLLSLASLCITQCPTSISDGKTDTSGTFSLCAEMLYFLLAPREAKPHLALLSEKQMEALSSIRLTGASQTVSDLAEILCTLSPEAEDAEVGRHVPPMCALLLSSETSRLRTVASKLLLRVAQSAPGRELLIHTRDLLDKVLKEVSANGSVGGDERVGSISLVQLLPLLTHMERYREYICQYPAFLVCLVSLTRSELSEVRSAAALCLCHLSSVPQNCSMFVQTSGLIPSMSTLLQNAAQGGQDFARTPETSLVVSLLSVIFNMLSSKEIRSILGAEDLLRALASLLKRHPDENVRTLARQILSMVFDICDENASEYRSVSAQLIRFLQ
eukprot:gnl/Chilomastix_cuspidata/4045.p1 GENE.gnl/Chilomastix_cuspidata/4045~~gnl/Chilomastix_cuspidata/4045.p1  ORF type:complete len:1309 (+),score=137.07 gnl/Chilomastix_cuspidata/4045:3-3929(+)